MEMRNMFCLSDRNDKIPKTPFNKNSNYLYGESDVIFLKETLGGLNVLFSLDKLS